MSCSHVKPIPPNTWIAVPPSCANASLANAPASVAARWRLLGRRVVGRPARVVARGAAELDGAQHVGAEMLDRLERADRLVELHPLLGVLDRELERARRGTDAVDDVRGGQAIERAGHCAARVACAQPPPGGVGERRTARPCGTRRPSPSARPQRLPTRSPPRTRRHRPGRRAPSRAAGMTGRRRRRAPSRRRCASRQPARRAVVAGSDQE